VFRNVVLMQAVPLALGWLYARLLLAACRRLGRGEATLAWAQVPAGLLAFVLGLVCVRVAWLFLVVGVVFWSATVWIPIFCLSALRRSAPAARAWLAAAAIASLGVGADALLVEPFAVHEERIEIPAARLATPLRVLHLSDLQTSWFGPREERVISLAAEARPDLVVLTGDYVSGRMDREASIDSARRVLRTLQAPLGVFAVSGDSEGDAERERIFEGLPITWLRNESRRLDVAGQEIWVVGLENATPDAMRAMAGVPAAAFTILLHHHPDVVLRLGGVRPDVVLAGHTHGGQVALPFVGPLLTLDHLGPRYASGLFDWDGMPLYVNRGIGLEGNFAPPVRFLCSPIVALLLLRPGAARAPIPSR
jgi:uncharacterized protein